MKRIIILHGVGGTGFGMQGLAEVLGSERPTHCPEGPMGFDMGGTGRQWFSVKGVTEANRPARISAAMPAFRAQIAAFGPTKESLLIGFSQGAIMALHALADGLELAGVAALSGRLAGPVAARDWPPICLIHGAQDPIMPPACAQATQNWLEAAGAEASLHLIEGLGHAIDARVLTHLRGFIATF